MELLERMDEARLDALFTLLESPKVHQYSYAKNNLYVCEDDRAQIAYRDKQVAVGNIEDLDAWKSLKNLRNGLSKKKK